MRITRNLRSGGAEESNRVWLGAPVYLCANTNLIAVTMGDREAARAPCMDFFSVALNFDR